jgi:hypothetical protein
MTTARQLSFAGGEITPSLYGRVDQTKYATGLRTCRNGLVMRHGGVQNRPGTEFITEVKDSTKAVKLIPFIFNPDQTYVLEFGDQYMRVIKNGVQLPAGGPAYEIVTPYLEAELPEVKYVQSADVIYLVHPNHAPRRLTRAGDTNWTLAVINFVPSIGTPASVGVAGAAGAVSYTYNVTAVAKETWEEGLAASGTTANLQPPDVSAHTITWPAVPNAHEYNIYQVVNGVPSFVGVAQGTSFVNNGIPPDVTDNPPIARNPFVGAGNYPSAVSLYQQRLVLATTNNDPEKIWASRTALFTNFTLSSPQQDDDAVTFILAGRQVNEVRDLVELQRLVVFTQGGEFAINGNEAGALISTSPNARQHTQNGSGILPPLIVNSNALYVQGRGTVVRDLGYDIQVDGYRGPELSIFAAHLFDRFTVEDWAYQRIPHSIVWAVRDDGVLLGLTYVPEHQVWAWHRHDTLGTFENVAVVPEGNEDSLYVVVRRLINSTYVRYIERMGSRLVEPDEIEEAIFVDSSLAYDGRNTSATTMTLSGGPPWVADSLLTLTASAGFFVVGDEGNEIHINDATGDEIRCRIVGYTSPTVVTVRPHKDVPASLQGVATTDWARAVDTVAGLSHLEGENVSIFGDGYVEANPNNPSLVTRTVTGGQVTIPERYKLIRVGLPYLMDIETLDLDSLQGETLIDKSKLITALTMTVEESRGIWAGVEAPAAGEAATSGLRELKYREGETYGGPVSFVDGPIDIIIPSDWNRHGRVFIRQIDPVPLSILNIAPSGIIPYKR